MYYILLHSHFFTFMKNNNPDNSINAFSESSVTKEFNQNGNLIYTVNSQYSEHIKKPDHINLKEPRITITQPKKPTWHISAGYGQSYPKEHKIILSKHVILHRPAQLNAVETTIKTKHLVYYKLKKMAISRGYTTIIQPHEFTSGSNVTVNTMTNTIQIHKNSLGDFSPHPPSQKPTTNLKRNKNKTIKNNIVHRALH